MTAATEPILTVRDLTVAYRNAGIGVERVNLQVTPGAVVTLIGPNGAGKSSTLRGITGFLPREPGYVASGEVEFLGERITQRTFYKLSRSHLAFVPEEKKIFSELTVTENLAIGRGIGGRAYARQLDTALELFPELKPHLHRRAGLLSGGQRQMLAVASALCTAPKLLVIDEMTLGLAPQLVRALRESLARIVGQGLPILMAEQNNNLALSISSTVHLLAAGRQVASGAPGEIRDRPEFSEAFLGA